MKAVLDSNILVSGFLFGGIPLKIIRAALEKQFIYVTSPDLMKEAENTLSSSKFGLTIREIEDLTQPLFETAEVVVPKERVTVIQRCPADNRVLECAVAGSCDAIVTGDKRDLLRLGSYRSIKILTPRVFNALLAL